MAQTKVESVVESWDNTSEEGPTDVGDRGQVIPREISEDKFEHVQVQIVSGDHGRT
jgi:hypothetical protein